MLTNKLGQLPHELGSEFKKLDVNNTAPSIFVTTHQDHFNTANHHHQPLVPTQNRPNNSLLPSITFSSTLPPSPNPTNLVSSSSTTAPSSSLDKNNNNYYQTNTSQSPSQVLAVAQAAASVTVTLPDIMNSPTPTHQTSNNRNNHFSFSHSSHHTMNG